MCNFLSATFFTAIFLVAFLVVVVFYNSPLAILAIEVLAGAWRLALASWLLLLPLLWMRCSVVVAVYITTNIHTLYCIYCVVAVSYSCC